MKFLPAILAAAFALAGCATPNDQLAFAEAAIQRGEWESAYRSLESVVGSSVPAREARAQELLMQYAQLTEAAKATFSPESVARTIASYGEERGITTERWRLGLFRTLASSADYERARANVEAAAVEFDARRREQEATKEAAARTNAQKQAEANEAAARRIAAILLERDQASQEARILCRSRDECQKVFSLAQIYITENADMKIQVATDTIVETYNATEPLRVSLKAARIPGSGESSVVVLSGSCRGEAGEYAELCARKMTLIYRGYPRFVKGALQN